MGGSIHRESSYYYILCNNHRRERASCNFGMKKKWLKGLVTRGRVNVWGGSWRENIPFGEHEIDAVQGQ